MSSSTKTTKPIKRPKTPSPDPAVEKQLDRELEGTFPASDPPSLTEPKPGDPKPS
jgi:hypothetical protein